MSEEAPKPSKAEIDFDAEMDALYGMQKVLEPLSPEARARALGYFLSRYGIPFRAVQHWFKT